MDLSDMSAAIPLFQRMLAADPTNAAALDQLEAIYRSAERWADLESLLVEAARRAAEPGARIELLDRAAVVAEHKLADAAEAMKCREQMVALGCEDRRNFDALERLYEAHDEVDKLRALRARRAGGAG
jgi:hypothetical protein